MKQLIITITMVAAMFTACNCNKNTDPTLNTDSVSFEKKDKTAEVTVSAEYPMKGNPLLTDAIAEYINEALGGTYEGPLTAGDSLAAYYGSKIHEELKKEAADFHTDDMPPLLHSQVFIKLYETDKFVTYTSSCDTYTGGAHGLHVFYGTTFRKSDGRRLGFGMLRETGSDDFHKLIKEGLMRYFAEQDESVNSDEALKDCLLTDASVDYLPLPQSAPYLTEKGMAFVYQAYEIAPYAAGLPTFIVPYDKIKPYLTVTARRMVE